MRVSLKLFLWFVIIRILFDDRSAVRTEITGIVYLGDVSRTIVFGSILGYLPAYNGDVLLDDVVE